MNEGLCSYGKERITCTPTDGTLRQAGSDQTFLWIEYCLKDYQLKAIYNCTLLKAAFRTSDKDAPI